MASTPVWTTTIGKITSIDEQVLYSKQLEATDSTAITYSIIAGSLPSGMGTYFKWLTDRNSSRGCKKN
jgi:hypothetical protein